jgi:hypothetical protein
MSYFVREHFKTNRNAAIGHKVGLINDKSGFKGPNCFRGQGADLIWKRSVLVVREHFKTNRNAAIGHKVGL